MKRLSWLLLAAGLAACGGEHPAPAAGGAGAPASAAKSDPAQVDSLMARIVPAASVTFAIQASPASADSILAEHQFTLDRYEATMYMIAADTAASQLFESALGR